MIRVFSAAHSAEAHLVKGLLESEGIAATVRGEDLALARGGVPITPDTGPSVWVLEPEDAERAREIVARFKADATPVGPAGPWRCTSCGESLEAQFTTCWNCGAERPDGPAGWNRPTGGAGT